jgi:hypothetical protein
LFGLQSPRYRCSGMVKRCTCDLKGISAGVLVLLKVAIAGIRAMVRGGLSGIKASRGMCFAYILVKTRVIFVYLSLFY